MVASLHNITFDTTGDPYELAQFWSIAVGRPMRVEDEPGDPEVSLIAEGQPAMLFIRVPDGKVVKNRVFPRRNDPGPPITRGPISCDLRTDRAKHLDTRHALGE